MDTRSRSTSRLKPYWTPGRRSPLPSLIERPRKYSRVSIMLGELSEAPNRSLQEIPPSVSKRPSIHKLLHRDSTSNVLTTSTHSSPDELFQSISHLPSATQSNLLKNRINDDLKRLTHSDLMVILHRKVLYEVLSQGTILAQLSPVLVEQMNRLPRLPDALGALLLRLSSKGDTVEVYQEAVLGAINKEIGLYQESITGLNGKVDELQREKQSLAWKIKELERSRQLDSQLSWEMSQLRSSPVKTRRRSPSPDLPKADPVMVLKRKIDALYSFITAANTSTPTTLQDMNDFFSKALHADSAFFFTVSPHHSHFEAEYKGMTYRVKSKNSILSLAMTNKELYALEEGDTAFDTRLCQQMGMSIRTMIVAPVLALGEPVGTFLMVNRRLESNQERLEQVKGEIGSLLQVYGLWMTVKRLKEEVGEAGETLRKVLESCVETLKQTNLSTALEKLGTVAKDLLCAERAHVLFCDSQRRELYYRKAEDSRSDHIFNFPSQKGIAGYCAHAREVLMFNNLQSEKKFCKEVDDPDGDLAICALCAPIHLSLDPNSYDLPYAVIVVLNKRTSAAFTSADQHRLSTYSSIISSLLQAGQIRENFFSLQGVMRTTVEAVTEVVQSMENSHKYTGLKFQLGKVEEVYTKLLHKPKQSGL